MLCRPRAPSPRPPAPGPRPLHNTYITVINITLSYFRERWPLTPIKYLFCFSCRGYKVAFLLRWRYDDEFGLISISPYFCGRLIEAKSKTVKIGDLEPRSIFVRESCRQTAIVRMPKCLSLTMVHFGSKCQSNTIFIFKNSVRSQNVIRKKKCLFAPVTLSRCSG